jgi:hypothetical protein
MNSEQNKIHFDIETGGLKQGKISSIFMGAKGKPTNFAMKTMQAAKIAGFNVVYIDLENPNEKLLCQLVKEMKANGALGNTK